MFGLVNCNASILARQNTDPSLYFVRTLVKEWLWPMITFVGVTGNILAIIVLTKRRMIMSSTNNYLVALALMDTSYLLLTLILNTSQNPCFRNRSVSDIILTICRPIADFSSNSSVWLTVTFTVERWVAITYPLQSRTWCTVHHARKIVLGVLFASLICTLPSAFEMKLVKTIEAKNLSDSLVYTTRIRAEPTALGSSSLYHQIYFNFVTFAIIWIPLLLLLIFNTVLIYYVRRSRDNKQTTSEGIQLRRHSRGNQGEQRKTTIMLIAVVIVFTVCQIPQAISLSLQSFFPILAQSSKVLIYNNFANCFVALNASINFLLYCCFSDRFRATFRSNFAFLSKYCAHYIRPDCSLNAGRRRRPTNSTSFENMSNSYTMINQSNYSLPVTQVNHPASNLSYEANGRYSTQLPNQQSISIEADEELWIYRLPILSKFSAKSPTKSTRIKFQEAHRSHSSDSIASSPASSILKSPSSSLRPTATFQIPDTDEPKTHSIPNETTPFCPSIIERSSSSSATAAAPKRQSSSLHTLSRPTVKFRQHLVSCSLGDEHSNTAPVWIKRRLSNSALERSFCWQEIMDVTV